MAVSGTLLPRGVARSKEPDMKSLVVYGLAAMVKWLPVYE